MKKFMLFLSAVVTTFSPVLAGENKKSNKRLNFELMEPVKLKNPTALNWGLEAAGPKHTIYKKVKPATVVIEETEVVEPIVVETPVKEEVKPVVIKTEEKKVEPVKQENPVVNIPEEPFELKEEAPVVKEEKQEISQTDKNIDEAKKLLRVAEKLANSVAEDDEVVIEKKEVVKPVIATSSEKPSFIIKFAKDAEELKKSDEKKIADMIPAIKANSDVTVKIISYYSANSGRNIAFSRLLNARKVLLEKDVPTSQIMIMVLEDEEKKAPKSDILEVFFVR
ncbi:MAG: hypothetical protein IJ473_02945 [Alphaproteobacteria bacterium]|nr:hypothetical protein [Alphaproteobacteria bacterium]